jgi:hypothetical protein
VTAATLATSTRPPPLQWTRKGKLAFRELKKALTDTPILQHFDLAKPIILQTDVSGLAIAGNLNQYDGVGSV